MKYFVIAILSFHFGMVVGFDGDPPVHKAIGLIVTALYDSIVGYVIANVAVMLIIKFLYLIKVIS